MSITSSDDKKGPLACVCGIDLIHLQRWTDALAAWVKELVWQGVKNGMKWGMIKAMLTRKKRGMQANEEKRLIDGLQIFLYILAEIQVSQALLYHRDF